MKDIIGILMDLGSKADRACSQEEIEKKIQEAKAFDLTDVKDIIYHKDYLYLLIKNYRTKLNKDE